MEKLTVHPQPKKKKHIIRNVSIITLILIIIFFTILYFTAQFFDNYRMVFQNPVLVALRAPIYISQRLVKGKPPTAKYIVVNPLTSPKQIEDTIRKHESFDYIKSADLEPISSETVKALIKNKVIQKWGESAWKEVDYILTNESGYNPYIVNQSSGACGIFQALPCSKLPSLDITDQINWGIDYIAQRYDYKNGKTPSQNAYDFKKAKGWY